MITTQKNKMKLMALSLISIAMVSGCSVSSKKTVNISQPMSVLTREAPSDQTVEEEQIPRSIAVLPLINETKDDIAGNLLRSVIQNHFTSKNFQLVNWQEVDRQITYSDSNKPVDPVSAIQNLGVDGVVTGQVKEFSLLHAGIYSEISMTVDLQLRNAKGEIVWQTSENVTTRAGGISTSPWGLLLNAATATLHLSEKNMLAAADELGRSLAKQIPEPSGYQGAIGPFIEQVLHDGAGKILNYGDELSLGLRGAPGQRASVSIDGVQSFDLPEIEPGVYLKKVTVSANWDASNSMLTGRLTDNRGVVSTWVSPTGLLNFDNTPPKPVTALMLATGDNGQTLSWQNQDSDATQFKVYMVSQNGSKELGQTAEQSLKLEKLPLFATVRLDVRSIDEAGNESQPSILSQRVYPMTSVAKASIAESNLNTDLQGNILLSASNSPYSLSSELVIRTGQQLYVEPGVEIQMSLGGSLNIEGDAWFWGEEQGIKIIAKADQAPKQFMTINTNGHVQIDNVSFENGNVAINILSGAPTFNKANFVNNQYNALDISGSAAPTFSNSRFEGSRAVGVIITDYAKPIFKNSQFKNNSPFHIQSSAVYPVAAEGNTWEPAASNRTILGEVRY